MKTAAVVLCALLLAGCDSTGGPAKAHPSSAASGGLAGGAPPAPRFDPPHRFAEASAVIDGGPLVVLDGVAYYYTYDGPAAADLATGRPRWAVRLPGTQREVMGRTGKDKPPVPGIITDAQGKALVVAAYDEEITGTGIQQDTARTIVAGIDLSGRTRWTAAVSADLQPRVVGGVRDDRGPAMVLDVDHTLVLDADSGSVRWTAKDVRPGAVDGTTIMGVRHPGRGYDPWSALGLRSTDGSQAWSGPVVGTGSLDRSPAFTPAGPGRAVIAPTEADRGTTMLIEIATGRRIAAVPRELDCRYDDKATIVCSALATFTDEPELMGIDAGTGQKLWSLPDKASGRTAIDVTAAFHGAVYGSAEHGAVVLDARTGADLVPDATLAPTRVVPGYGLLTDGHKTSVYPATA